MSDAARDAVLQGYCRELKLPTTLREYPALARQGSDGGWRYEEFFCHLLEAEVSARRQGTVARLVREARFPDAKTLDQIQWDDLHGVDRKQVAELSSCEYLGQGEDVVIAGPIGTGKSHLAIALGVEAARRRYRVAFLASGGPGKGVGGGPGTNGLSPDCTSAIKRWRCSSWMNWGLCPSTASGANSSSTCCRTGTNAAPPW